MNLGNDKIVSGTNTISKLLVSLASETSRELLGKTSLDRAEVNQWMDYCETHVKPSLQDTQQMNTIAEVILLSPVIYSFVMEPS